jgi:uncharacterized membrane protein YeiB
MRLARAFATRGADLAKLGHMSRLHISARALRAEAGVLSISGLALMAIGFPLTLMLVAQSLAEGGLPPMFPVAVGAPPLMLGYLACFFASQRLVRAKALEG